MKVPDGVSVIICTWNRSALLAKTLSSLKEQVRHSPVAVEVVVVDNNSTDQTRQLVHSLSMEWPAAALRYEFEPKQGKQFALNRGIRLASYSVLAFTDDDILFPHDWITQAHALLKDGSTDLVGGQTKPSWPGGVPPSWYSQEMQAIVGGVDLGSRRLEPAPVTYAPAGGNLVARRDLFDRIGLFSEAHFRHMDFEFGMRCQAKGVRIAYDPRLTVEAPVDPMILTKRYFRRWSFKAGIAQDVVDDQSRSAWRRVPLWRYRQALGDALFLVFGGLTRPAAERFNHELRFWRNLGAIVSAWHCWIRPSGHDSWVARLSQKKNNIY
jgi:glycosyltransferase involved in cell wall biosynthesis